MDDINDEFAETDLVIVVGANDVINPAANTAEGTPIYGMPILNAHQAKACRNLQLRYEAWIRRRRQPLV